MADLGIALTVAIALAVVTVLAVQTVLAATIEIAELSLLDLLRQMRAHAVDEETTLGRDVWPDSTQMEASSTLLPQLVPHRLHRLEEVNSLLSRLRQRLSRLLRPIESNRQTLSR